MTGPGLGHGDDDLAPLVAPLLVPGWERALVARDQAGLEANVRAAWRVVYQRARATIADPGEAEEIAQEVFCRVLLRMSGATGQELEVRTGYLVRAARNLMADRWRARARHRAVDARYAESRSSAPELPEDLVTREEEHTAVREALGRLPPLQRQVLRLRIIEQLNAEETGAVVGRSADAVRQIQHRALAALRVQLEAQDAGGGA